MTTDFASIYNEFSQPILDSLEGFTSKVIGPIGPGITLPKEVLDQLSDKIKQVVAESIAKASNKAQASQSLVFAEILTELEGVNSTAALLTEKSLSESQTILEAAKQLIEDQEQSILGQIAGGLDSTLQLVTGIETNIQGFVSDQVTPAVQAVAKAVDKVSNLGAAFDAGVNKLIGELGLPFMDQINLLKDALDFSISKIGTRMLEELAPDLRERIDPILQLLEGDEDVPDEIKALTSPGILPLAAVGGLLAGVAIPMIISNLMSPVLDPYIQKLRQRILAKVQPTLMTPADLARGEWQGLVQADRVVVHSQRQGMTQEDINVIRELVKVRPGTLDVIDYWRRELVDEAALDSELRLIGWTPDWIKTLKVAAFPPPGVQDLITMAVREVFTPEIAERFGQFEDLPQAFVDNARAVGLSEVWAGRFWAAHWRLPSVQQGFEALHRTTEQSLDAETDTITLPSGKTIQTVIGTSTLDLLLKSSDVMPFWRPMIRQIAFRPYTRVDVRRMHKVGVLTEDDVFRAYLDLGYDQDKAKGLTAFTLALNAPGEDSVAVRERDLSKGDVLGLFNDGLLLDSEATSILVEMGFDQVEADLLVQREITQEAARQRREDIKLIVDQAKGREITFDQAMDKLNELNLTQAELQKAGLGITRALQVRTRSPARSDLIDWFSIGLLTMEEYVEELRGLSFSDKHIFNILMQAALDFKADQIKTLRTTLRGMAFSEEVIESGLALVNSTLATLTSQVEEDGDNGT